jgi:hypothetical protein
LEARVRSALEAVLEQARAEGCADPVLYVEPESGLHVLDRNHPAYDADGPGRLRAGSEQPAIVFSLLRALPIGTDAGAW